MAFNALETIFTDVSIDPISPSEEALFATESLRFSGLSREALIYKYLELRGKYNDLKDELDRMIRLAQEKTTRRTTYPPAQGRKEIIRFSGPPQLSDLSEGYMADFMTNNEPQKSTEERANSNSPVSPSSSVRELHRKINLLKLKIFSMEQEFESEKSFWEEETKMLSNENFILKQSLAIHKEKLYLLNHDKGKLALEAETQSEKAFNNRKAESTATAADVSPSNLEALQQACASRNPLRSRRKSENIGMTRPHTLSDAQSIAIDRTASSSQRPGSEIVQGSPLEFLRHSYVASSRQIQTPVPSPLPSHEELVKKESKSLVTTRPNEFDAAFEAVFNATQDNGPKKSRRRRHHTSLCAPSFLMKNS